MVDFIGQNHFITELDILWFELQKEKNANILFRGPSGYGKTNLALRLVGGNKLGRYEYLIPEETGVNLGNVRTHIIDEIHLLKNQEILYPRMDADKDIFIFCTNSTENLKEAFVNRCYNFWFREYSFDEICQVIQDYMRDIYKELPREYIIKIAENSQGNPRISKKLCERLVLVFRHNGYPDFDGLNNYITNVLGIVDGFSPQQAKYLLVLGELVKSSITNLVTLTQISESEIKRDVEPYLLYKKLIKITSKGRELC